MVLSKGGDMDTLVKLHSLDSVRLGWKLGTVGPQLAPLPCVPAHSFSLCILSSQQGPPLPSKPALTVSAELVAGCAVIFHPVCPEHWCPPLETSDPPPGACAFRLITERGWLHQHTAFPKWQPQRLLPPGFDTLQPGPVPGVSKLGPGFLLLFSIHTAAAFITAP